MVAGEGGDVICIGSLPQCLFILTDVVFATDRHSLSETHIESMINYAICGQQFHNMMPFGKKVSCYLSNSLFL